MKIFHILIILLSVYVFPKTAYAQLKGISKNQIEQISESGSTTSYVLKKGAKFNKSAYKGYKWEQKGTQIIGSPKNRNSLNSITIIVFCHCADSNGSDDGCDLAIQGGFIWCEKSGCSLCKTGAKIKQ